MLVDIFLLCIIVLYKSICYAYRMWVFFFKCSNWFPIPGSVSFVLVLIVSLMSRQQLTRSSMSSIIHPTNISMFIHAEPEISCVSYQQHLSINLFSSVLRRCCHCRWRNSFPGNACRWLEPIDFDLTISSWNRIITVSTLWPSWCIASLRCVGSTASG